MKLFSNGACAWRKDPLSNRMMPVPLVFSLEEALEVFGLDVAITLVLCISTGKNVTLFCTTAEEAFNFFNEEATNGEAKRS